MIAEHRAVRAQAGLFDVSHMGEATLRGADALGNLNRLLTNDFTGMKDGQARYSPMCDENGGTVDDLLVYKFGEGDYMLVLNAANREKDVKWIAEHLSGDVVFEDVSDGVAQIALQGPASEEILRAAKPEWALPKRNYRFKAQADALVSRTGYTGEDGFEIYLKPEKAAELWDALLEAGKPFGLIPCGLGARDTLRMEAAMPLYGHELSADITPLEAGLDVFVKLDKPEFIGRQGLLDRGARVRPMRACAGGPRHSPRGRAGFRGRRADRPCDQRNASAHAGTRRLHGAFEDRIYAAGRRGAHRRARQEDSREGGSAAIL